ncbi:hypothetical protein HK102_004526 [Quaeritorhiza haematococci]|nr:hypothetical protein HK102_004526 [Quaeritorhiza haematococci]
MDSTKKSKKDKKQKKEKGKGKDRSSIGGGEMRVAAEGSVSELVEVVSERVDEVEEDLEMELEENRGDEIIRSYQPPPGFVEFDVSRDLRSSSLESHKVNGDDKELWLIRVPLDVSLQSLTQLKIHLNDTSRHSSSHSHDSDIMGKVSISRAPTKSQKTPAGASSSSSSSSTQNGDVVDTYGLFNAKVHGEEAEMAHLTCLVPDVMSNVMKVAPKSFSRLLTLKSVVDVPDTNVLVTAAEKARSTVVPPREHQEDLDRFKYIPFGSETDGVALEESLARYKDDLDTLPSEKLKAQQQAALRKHKSSSSKGKGKSEIRSPESKKRKSKSHDQGEADEKKQKKKKRKKDGDDDE